MRLPLPIRPAEIPFTQWDIFLEKYYIPYLQANYQRIMQTGVLQEDVNYFTVILDKLAEKHYNLSGLGFWGALIGGVISAIPSAVGAIANYKLGKSTLKLQKEEMEARKQREAAEAEAVRKQNEAIIQQQVITKQASVSNRAIEAVKEYSPFLIGGGIILVLAIFLLKRR